jgi:hypothetical protein
MGASSVMSETVGLLKERFPGSLHEVFMSWPVSAS